MIERINQINRVYSNFIEQHTYKTQTDPKTLQSTTEHLVCRIYTKQGQIQEMDFKHLVDLRV
jgi:hypothetical protein